jgi:uncharacterized protein
MTEAAQADIDGFLAGSPFAVAGASKDRSKFGNKVLRAYQQQGREVYPVNPSADEVEGVKAYPDLNSLPTKPHGVSIVTPPNVTEKVVDEAIELGVKFIWMQPGAESDAAITKANQAGANVIARGPCVLVELGFAE